MAFKNITDPYTRWESGLYDRLIAQRFTDAFGSILQKTGFTFIFDPPRPLDVLDVGCGGGQNELFLQKKNPLLKLTGLDLSADQIRRARTRDREKRVGFVVGDALALPFPDASFDVVLSLGSMKHWPDMKKGLQECLRVLRPQGRLMIMDARRDSSPEDVRAFFRLLRLPSWAYPLFRLFFGKVVLRQSPTMETLQRIVGELPGSDLRLTAMPDFPGFSILL